MQAVVIAAGESSRFWPLNEKHKTLTKICGRPLIGFLIEELKKAGLKDIIIVQSQKREIERELKDRSLKYAIQKKTLGTGDALLAAEKLVTHDQFLLVNAEQQNVGGRLDLIIKEFKKTKRQLIVVGSPTRTPWIFGVLRLKGDRVLGIVEKPRKGKEPSRLKNVGDYFLPRQFFNYLKKIPSHPYSLVQAISLYAQENPVGLVRVKEETLSLKYPWHLFPILEAKLTGTGFKIKIAKSAKIGKNVVISGQVVIGEGTIIGDNDVIKGPAYIGGNCQIGANNVFRGPVDIEDNVQTGALFEAKNSLIGEGTHFHSGYLGNSLIGSDCRFGAGFISANQRIDRKNIFSVVKEEKIDTGLTRFGTVIGANTKAGIKIGTMPGVFIGKNCIIWPGTVVFKNIPDGTVFKGKRGNP